MSDDIACRRCGCNDVALLGRFDSWGQPMLKLRCGHCLTQWSQNAPQQADRSGTPEPAFYVPVCRDCGDRMKVTTTQELRSVKCKRCGRSEKLREIRVPV